MLIKCPECQLQASDKALCCPHCGYPFKHDAKLRTTRKSNRRKRLPNGFGQISEIKDCNLRKPFRAMVTVGKNSVGRPICKPLKPESFFATYNDAYAALVEYNKNPYDLNDDMTIKQLYEKWSEQYFETLKSKSSIRTITSAWSYCSEIYDMRVKDLRARHIKGCMEEGISEVKGVPHGATAGTKGRIKSMFNLMLDYALEYELVDRNYARTFNVSDDIIKEKEEAKRGHMAFTDDEMQSLWNNVENIEYVDVVLIQCYSGWRPQELGLIKIDRVDLETWSFVGGMKTEAGIDRFVPIHTKIREFVKKRYDEAVSLGSEYLINCTDTHTHRSNNFLTYEKYRQRFNKIISRLNMKSGHRPHDGRMQFITMAKRNNVDEYAIKYMAGHKIEDITERVYTERDKQWLSEEIEKIK